MKNINLYKIIPFLITLFIILFLSINNQKLSTNLKILFWTTPSLSLGSYLFISSGAGYIFSYLVTTKLANYNLQFKKNKIKYKMENEKEDDKKNSMSYKYSLYENTLIERDIKEPSPTINASFRVIGKTRMKVKDNFQHEGENSNLYNEYDQQYADQKPKYNKDVKSNQKFDDWEDYTYLNW